MSRSTSTRLAAEPLLSIEGIDVSYGQTQVLFGVDLKIREGELVALLGTNGAGKSTVLRAVAGLTPPSRGTVRFAGQDITKLDARSTSRLGITQVPGGRGVFPSLTVADNLRVAGWSHRKDRAELRRRHDQCLEWFPALGRRMHTAAGDLSGGEQQMLSLSQALLGRPRLLMIDELSLGLAPAVVEDLLHIVRAIHADGTAVVLVEQSVTTALRLADRAVFMEKGEVRFEGPTADLLERDDILRAVYLHGTAGGSANGRAKPKRAKVKVTATAAAPTEPAAPVLEAIGITKHYGGVTAVDEVDLRLADGELLGVIGPNGAGKTTVFDLLTGFTVPDHGRVILHGVDVTGAPAHRRARLGLGRTFQDARLWPSLTVRECLVVACERNLTSRDPLSAVLRLPAQRESEAVAGASADDLIELVGVQAFAGKFLSELSTGSRRMVEIACLLANGATTLLLDEPSSGIAQRETEALGPVLLDLRVQLGASIVLIEHDMQLLTSVADRLLALDTGSVVTDGDAASVLSHPQVVASYLGERASSSVG
jgi:ABC-type branched-subunit amino acid transport system ATPase component